MTFVGMDELSIITMRKLMNYFERFILAWWGASRTDAQTKPGSTPFQIEVAL
jgi:hypothetical protein